MEQIGPGDAHKSIRLIYKEFCDADGLNTIDCHHM
jgi:hypothetical protein